MARIHWLFRSIVCLVRGHVPRDFLHGTKVVTCCTYCGVLLARLPDE